MSQHPTEAELLALKGKQIPVLELLALFGARLRNELTVPLIEQALKDAGLSTLPDFATCNSNADVQIVTREAAPESAESPEEEAEELPRGGLPQNPIRVGDIPSAVSGLYSVTPDKKLSEITYLMSNKNYSQIPVIEGGSFLRGVVTWRSVVKAYERVARPDLSDALVDPPVVESHHDFFSLLPRVSEEGYLLVRANNGSFCGIVTAADITERFGATAWPFFVIGEIEFRLRKCLGAKIGPDAIRAVQPNQPRMQTGLITDLMFNGYVKLLDGEQQNPALRVRADENWKALGWRMNRTQFVRQLDRVRLIRNSIAHFDAEPLTPKLSDELRGFLRILRELT
ncbi:CBS domain-containing protein [Streptomyces sp. DvalAA-19]|uniref:CBS domain-containing protein n=1 Tax=Streptomyces sp. DvalAA-19 TaxID=1839761 RepID=UPI00081B255A|nr:CBS domain-containing protein [Streptomyces sp. DvalAA-19]SCD32082.1 CBS domain-containing protein [Streptomyces sp. DvalAA-19]